MARQRRLVVAGLPHLLCLPALTGVDPFPDTSDRSLFIALLGDRALSADLQLHAFALLTDEARLLATPAHPQALASYVQAIGRRYVGAYNRRYQRSGTIWAGRFRCALVEPGGYLLRSLLFVEGASTDAGRTSAPQRCGQARQWPLTDPAEYWALGNTPFERETAYVAMLADALPMPEAQRIRRCLSGGWPYASESFAHGLGAAGERPVQPRPRGRPARDQPRIRAAPHHNET